jgi:hypothetical protein
VDVFDVRNGAVKLLPDNRGNDRFHATAAVLDRPRGRIPPLLTQRAVEDPVPFKLFSRKVRCVDGGTDTISVLGQPGTDIPA